MNNNQGLNPNQNPNGLGSIPVNSPIPPQNIQPNQQSQILNQVNNNVVNPINNAVGVQNNIPNNQPVQQPVLTPGTNNFFNPSNQINNAVNLDNSVTSNASNNTSNINDLNVDGTYNRINVAPDYVNDKQVKDNMEASKKNTVPVSKELKTVIVIAAILLIFIIVMPFLFDLISNIRFH